MHCKTKRSARGARPAAFATPLAAAALAALSCDFLGELSKPFDYSTVTLRGTVLDCSTGLPVSTAAVLLDGEERAETNDNGLFLFPDTRTGAHTVIIAKIDYERDTFAIDLTLDARPDTFSLAPINVPPVIVYFSASPETLLAIDDTVRFCFTARDSTGGIIKTIVDPGSGATIEKAWPGAPRAVADTARWCYREPGAFVARLTIEGKNEDTARDSVSIVVPDNRRPLFTLVRLSQDGFVGGEWGFVEVYARDPDGDFHCLTIDWGDTSKVEKSYDSAAAHWHKYAFTNDTQLTISVRLFDSSGASRDTALRVEVRNVSPPKLDDKIVFVPSQFLTPYDTVITIGVKVLAIEGGYVSAILWKLNQTDPGAAQSVRKDYTPQTGKIGVTGNVFAQPFGTAKLKETNTVEIIVADKNGRIATVLGNFYKAGYRRVPGFLAPGF